jgi:hypothetical protein
LQRLDQKQMTNNPGNTNHPEPENLV